MTNATRCRRIVVLLSAVVVAAAAPALATDVALPGRPDPALAARAGTTPIQAGASVDGPPSAAPCPPPTVVVQTPPAVCPTGWEVRRTQLALYAWLAGIDADLRAGPLEASVDLSFSDILSKLDFAFMGYYETTNGRKAYYLDAIHMRLSGENTQPATTVGFGVTQTLLEAGLILMGGTPARGMDGFVGVQYIGMSNDLSFSPQGVSASKSMSCTRPVIGSRYRTTFSDRWSGTVRAEIGFNSTWQALVTLRYRLNEKTSVGVGYRYLHLDLKDGDFALDGAMSGPLVGVGWDL